MWRAERTGPAPATAQDDRPPWTPRGHPLWREAMLASMRGVAEQELYATVGYPYDRTS